MLAAPCRLLRDWTDERGQGVVVGRLGLASPMRIREDDAGVCRTPEDTAPTRFETVRPRVQIPGPRPISEYDPCVTPGRGRGPTGRRGRRAHLASGSRPPWRSRTQSCQPRVARTATPDSMARQI